MQEVARGSRVMATAASNIAVDNLVERLVAASPKLRVVRMGHPARLSPSVRGNSSSRGGNKQDVTSIADCVCTFAFCRCWLGNGNLLALYGFDPHWVAAVLLSLSVKNQR